MGKKVSKIVSFIIFFSGFSILLYPLVSQYWNSKVQSRVVADYNNLLTGLNSDDYDSIFIEVQNYNQKISKLEYPLIQYKKISNDLQLFKLSNGMIGYISIDKINLELPIYHGTSASVLNEAVGHLEGSSLPVGGESTHSVLSAHRGLPSSTLFTNLNKLEIGDTFEINVLDTKLTYKIDEINIVTPTDISKLEIIEGKDYLTLMTCTPYGINTHRLLVRGIRIENEKSELVITSDAYTIDKLIVTLVILIPTLLIIFLYVMFKPKVEKNYEEEEI